MRAAILTLSLASRFGLDLMLDSIESMADHLSSRPGTVLKQERGAEDVQPRRGQEWSMTFEESGR
jgi:hypothetical protein